MIDRIIKENPETANERILWQWFNGKGREPITCRTLIYVLHEIGHSELANEMASTCDILKIIGCAVQTCISKGGIHSD